MRFEKVCIFSEVLMFGNVDVERKASRYVFFPLINKLPTWFNNARIACAPRHYVFIEVAGKPNNFGYLSGPPGEFQNQFTYSHAIEQTASLFHPPRVVYTRAVYGSNRSNCSKRFVL